MASVGIIGWLLWPREAIAFVKKFEAEGTLNKEAVSFYYWQTIYYIFFWTIIIPGVFWISHAESFATLLLIASPALIVWTVRDTFKLFAIASQGKLIAATVKSAYHVGTRGGRQRIKYIIEDDGKSIEASTEGKFYKTTFIKTNPDFPRRGDQVYIYYWPEGKKLKALPDIYDLKDKYSFTTRTEYGDEATTHSNS